jgi:hypothetical protein
VDVPAGIFDADSQGLAGLFANELDGHRIEIVFYIELLLPAIDVEILSEIPLLIKKSDANYRDTKVRGAFQVVSRQDTESARINREAFVQAELGTEVCDGLVSGFCTDLFKPGWAFEIDIKFFGDSLELPEKAAVFGELFQSLLGDTGEQFDGIMAAGGPEVTVDTPEEVNGISVPGPKQVLSDKLKVL